MSHQPLATPYQDGVILRAELLAAGWDDRAIRARLSARLWHRIRPGAYMQTRLWSTLDERQRHLALAYSVRRAARCVAALSHVSAVQALHTPIWDMAADVVHVTRFDGKAGRREAGVSQHRGWLGAQDVTVVDRLLVTNATRTALDITTIADAEHALVVVDGLLHARQTTPELLQHSYGLMTYWPHTLETDLVLRLADGRSESVGETRTRFMCWQQGLPAPTPQYAVTQQGRVVAWLDLAWPELGVWIEFDGKEKYTRYLKDGQTPADAVFREKKREDRVRRLTGWICIRVTWADLYEPRALAARIRQAFADRVRAA